MSEMIGNSSEVQLMVRHRGRIKQIGIFFRKFLRMFVYQNDWKVLPMAALIAGLVGFALGSDFGKTMEGTLMGTIAIVCVCIWNGSFNSIQVVCRERDVVKREHRSGMHISSYIFAHMMYQLLLCTLQVIVTLIVLHLVGMDFTGKGLITPWLIADVGITMLLVTYAADLLSLWISTLVHTTTTAMTIMPFVLIFQLIFSGGLFSLPSSVDPIVMLTISSPGMKAMASQMQINSLPYDMVSSMLNLVDNVEIGGRVTIGQVLDALGSTENKTIETLRSTSIGNIMTIREIGEDLLEEDAYEDLRNQTLIENLTVGTVLKALMDFEPLNEILATEVGYVTTFGDVVDFLAQDATVRRFRDEGLTVSTTLGDVLDLVGRDQTKEVILNTVSESMYEPDYEYSADNVVKNWIHILIFVVVFAALSTITLEFIDKDKR